MLGFMEKFGLHEQEVRRDLEAWKELSLGT